MAIQRKLLYLLVPLLSSCSLIDIADDTYAERFKSQGLTNATIFDLQSEELRQVTPPTNMPVVAVYSNSFTDQTGQRKSN